jgi:hypothetical protein
MKPTASRIPALTSNDKPSAITHKWASLRDAVEADEFMSDAATLVGKCGGRNPRNSHLGGFYCLRMAIFGNGGFIFSSFRQKVVILEADSGVIHANLS